LSSFYIEVNGHKRQIVSRYIVPPEMYDDYLEYGGTMFFDEDSIVVPPQHFCILCERSFEETSKNLKSLCHRKEINSYYGYPVVICLDCRGYIEYAIEDDQRIPSSIRKVIDSGFRPKNIKRFE
jgi:hypothetical protein